jgi:serine/threonine-protein kinase
VGDTPTGVGGTPTEVGDTPMGVGGALTAMGGAPTAVGGAPTAVGDAPTEVGGAPTTLGHLPNVAGDEATSVGDASTSEGAPLPDAAELQVWASMRVPDACNARSDSVITVGGAACMMDAPIQPGDLLAGKYRVDAVLGAGAMGVVVAARDLALDRRVAIKVMKPGGSFGPDKRGRFLREARVVAKLRSEHVVKVLDMGSFQEAPFIVMEYLEGKDLAAVLAERGPFLVEEAVALVLQACDAIAEAHAAGIVHRDIKPANLFLTKGNDGSPKVKVVDFGIAKDDASGLRLTGTAEILGSPFYMSPEALRATKDVDERTDVWALGVCLFEMIAGVSPFVRDSIEALMAAVFHFPTPPLAQYRADVPAGLVQVVEHALEKKKELRFPTVAAFAVALAPYAPSQAASYAERAVRARGAAAMPVTTGGDPSAQPTRPPAPPPAKPVPVPAPVSPPPANSVPAATLVDPPSVAPGDVPPAVRARASRWATVVLVVLALAIVIALVHDLRRDRAPAGTASTAAPTVSGTVSVADAPRPPAIEATTTATATAATATPPLAPVRPATTTKAPPPHATGLPAWDGVRR